MNQDVILFTESYAAAVSLRDFWTSLASTYGCIEVSLSRKFLVIKPHLFIGWLIKLLGLDLNREIPLDRIKAVELVGTWFSHGKVKVTFELQSGETRQILLYLRQAQLFAVTLDQLIQR